MRKIAGLIGCLLVFSSAASADTSESICRHCGPTTVVIDENTKSAMTKNLQDSFTHSIGAAAISDCPILISENFGKGFSAFGGLCDVVIGNKKAQWMICADDGVGNFAAVTGARWQHDPEPFLTQFLNSNCVGG